jgi:exopolyphosphatase / guanosine-5'-triphosphate,3'-diphosphate pyrophosphatase
MIKREYEVVAAINLGTGYIDMSVVQIGTGGKVEVLEKLSHPTDLGGDSFSQGRIGLETMKECCKVLKAYKKIMNTYRVKRYLAISTSGMREAENSEYVIDQIKTKTGIEVKTISIAEERYYIYKALRKSSLDVDMKRNSLIVNIAYGGLEVSLYEEGGLKFTEYMKLGSLRIHEALSSLEYINLNYADVMREYFESKVNSLYGSIGEKNIDTLIALGGEVRQMLTILGEDPEPDAEYHILNRKKVKKLYETLSQMNVDQISDSYNLPKREAETLIPSITIIYSILEFIESRRIIVPMVSIVDGIADSLMEKSEFYDRPGTNSSYDDIISSVWFIAEKYGVSKDHAKYVSDIATSIYDQLERVHKLEDKHRLFLRAASILHDCGNYVSLSNHAMHSYNIIKSQNIMGFSDQNLEIIGNIARYHSGKMPSHKDSNYRNLSDSDKVIVSKLASILSIAEAVDLSHKEKIKEVQVKASGEVVLLTIKSDESLILETWEIKKRVKLFEEVYGLEVQIKVEKGID